VELGDVVRNLDAGRRLVSAYRLGLSDDEAIQGAPSGIAEGGDAVETAVEVRVQRLSRDRGWAASQASSLYRIRNLTKSASTSNIYHRVR
jgi:hypothetical protein